MNRRLDSAPLVWTAAFLLTLLVYGPLFFAPAIGDDLRFVRDNPLFSRPLAELAAEVLSTKYFAVTGEATYQPLVTLLHYFTHAEPAVYRLTGFLLHALNALLLWAIARRAGLSARASFAAALAFASFPANTETLAFSGFKGHVAAFAAAQGVLLCWIALLGAPFPRYFTAGAAGLLAFGLLCKETALVALPLCAAYSLCFSKGKARERQLGAGAALLAVAGLYAAWRFLLLEPPASLARPMPGPLPLLGWYVKMLLLPYPLCRERVWDPDTVWVVLGAAYFGLLWLVRRKPRALFASLWIGLCCLPFLRIVPFASDNAVADRYLYAPAAGFSLLLSLALSQGRAPYFFYGLIALWSAEALNRDALYTSRRGLCEQTVACAPTHPRAHTGLAQELILRNEFEPGRREALRALQLDASSAEAYNLLGIADFNLGDVDAAQDALDHALVFDPASADVRMNVASVLEKRGFDDEALEHYRMALQLRPDWDAPRQKVDELTKKIAAQPPRPPRRRHRKRR